MWRLRPVAANGENRGRTAARRTGAVFVGLAHTTFSYEPAAMIQGEGQQNFEAIPRDLPAAQLAVMTTALVGPLPSQKEQFSQACAL